MDNFGSWVFIHNTAEKDLEEVSYFSSRRNWWSRDSEL